MLDQSWWQRTDDRPHVLVVTLAAPCEHRMGLSVCVDHIAQVHRCQVCGAEYCQVQQGCHNGVCTVCHPDVEPQEA
jgi:hypothetical protein